MIDIKGTVDPSEGRAAALKRLRGELQGVDLVVEILDARVPLSSRNPDLSILTAQRSHLMLLHKADRADHYQTGRWLAHFQEQGREALSFSVQQRAAYAPFMALLLEKERTVRRGRFKRPLRIMLVGIPNVGKSTVLNRIVRRAAAPTGNRPGITRGKQWVRIKPGLELLDTPGILPPRLNEKNTAPLGAVGCLPASAFDPENTALWLLERILALRQEAGIYRRYGKLAQAQAPDILRGIAQSRGCLSAEGRLDPARAAALLLKDYQSGYLGRISLETAPVCQLPARQG